MSYSEQNGSFTPTIFAYVNWDKGYARAHKGVCQHCNHGEGKEDGPLGPGDAFVGFRNMEQARTGFRKLTWNDVRDCEVCRPGVIAGV